MASSGTCGEQSWSQVLPHGKGTVVTKSKAASDALATSRSLLDRVRVADEAAWDRLVTLYAPLVMHWCRLGSLDEQDADEGSAVSLDEEDDAAAEAATSVE